jgi:hypothetical protein
MNVSQYERDNNACPLLRCEVCNKIIAEGYLLGFETLEEAFKLQIPAKPGICLHPDNVLACKECLKSLIHK